MEYTRIKSSAENEVYAYCPLDKNFTADFINTVCSLAKTGVDFILFEDDYTLSGGKMLDVACCCDRHMKKYQEIISEDIDIKTLRKHLLFEGENKYRNAWLDLQGKTLEDFTTEIVKAVQAVNPKCRIGLSANSSSFLLEGTEIAYLARIIAGKNKPFIRIRSSVLEKRYDTKLEY